MRASPQAAGLLALARPDRVRGYAKPSPCRRMSRLRNAKSIALTTLTFALTAPLVATVAYSAWGHALADRPTEGGAGALLGTLWLIPFGYILGGLPAAATGLVTGLIAPQRPAIFVLAAALAGAAVAALWSALTATPPGVTEGVVNLAVIGAIAGAAAGFVSRLLARRLT